MVSELLYHGPQNGRRMHHHNSQEAQTLILQFFECFNKPIFLLAIVGCEKVIGNSNAVLHLVGYLPHISNVCSWNKYTVETQ